MANMKGQNRSTMSFRQLVDWAWTETGPVHHDRVNLLLHLVAVPAFVIGHVMLVAAIWDRPGLALAGLAAIFTSLIVQKIGHARENVEVHPFDGPYDFIRRLYSEQFCNFWRFLFSGQWLTAFRNSA